MKKERKWLDYTWVIVGAAFLMEFTALGFCSANKSLYLSAITDALDIKRSLFSINDSFRYLSTTILNLFFGSLLQRFGTRKMVGFGFAALIASMLVYAGSEHIWGFYIGGCLLGVGLSFAGTTMGSSIVKKWCKKNTGKITGFVLAANGLGGAVAAQIVSPIIYEEGNAFGYRNAYRLVALILVVVGILVVALLKENPEAGAVQHAKKKPRGIGWEGIDYAAAKTKPYFYLAAVCIFATGMVLQGITGISAAHMKDVGLDAGYVATVLSAHALALTAFKFFAGVSYDKYGLRLTVLTCEITAVGTTFLLAFVNNSAAGMVMAMIYGIFSSLALPLETVMVSMITGDLFGNKAFDKLLGIMMACNTAGFAVGTPLVNLCYDRFGTYAPVLFVFTGLMLVVTIVFQGVISAAGKERLALASAEAE